MLSRTADNLYWVSRYLERADFLARLIEASSRIAALPKAYAVAQDEWQSVLIASGADETFFDHMETADEASVIAYLAFDERNSSSIRNCIEFARTNARAVRTALTVEMWESINSGWLELKKFEAANQALGRIDREELIRFLEFVKTTSSLYDGYAYRTMLRNDAYYFSRLGVYIERADNTARVLDVKYHVLLPEQEADRRLGRLLPVDRDPALRFGLYRLSLGLPREHQAVECRRPADPALRNAALAVVLRR